MLIAPYCNLEDDIMNRIGAGKLLQDSIVRRELVLLSHIPYLL